MADEEEVWKGVSQELMSDEEDDGNELRVVTPQWRVEWLTDFIRTLDERCIKKSEEDDKFVLKKTRRKCTNIMTRHPSKKVPKEFVIRELLYVAPRNNDDEDVDMDESERDSIDE